MLTKLKKNKKGFTMVELIVVLAVIAILAAIMIPRFTGFTKDAREKAVIAEARSIQTAVEALIVSGDTSITADKVENFLGKKFDGSLSITDAANGSFVYEKDGIKVAPNDKGKIVVTE